MRNYCTLFDTNYLSRGLAMYESLNAVAGKFHLYIFAFDDKCCEILKNEKLQNATIISLNEFEDEKLLAIKPTRSRAEYCWTCTSSSILYCLEKFKLPQCTYVDADLYFYSSPEPIFAEFGSRSILLTEHRYSPQYAKDDKNGKFCVQFITFNNDERGMKALVWWRERCLEWCYARHEDGKFGDQGYLNDWETRFDGVYSLQHLGGGVAAWNVQQYRIYLEGEKLFGMEHSSRRDFELIFYHFHYLRFISNGTIELGRRTLTDKVLQLIYLPYVEKLEKIKSRLQIKYPGIDPHGAQAYTFTWKTIPLRLYRKSKDVYHIYDLNRFLSGNFQR